MKDDQTKQFRLNCPIILAKDAEMLMWSEARLVLECTLVMILSKKIASFADVKFAAVAGSKASKQRNAAASLFLCEAVFVVLEDVLFVQH